VLEEDPRHTKALQLHYRLEKANALRFKPSQPARSAHAATGRVVSFMLPCVFH
jgi:hypothetical protein